MFTPALRPRRGSATRAAVLAVVGSAVVLAILFWMNRAAAMPGEFPADATLASAAAVAKTSGKPVLVFVHAPWCGACQQLKRGALADPAVAQLITARTSPVAINFDQHKDDARRLGVESLPALVLLRDGQPAALIKGVNSADTLKAWLERNIATLDSERQPAPAPAPSAPSQPTPVPHHPPGT